MQEQETTQLYQQESVDAIANLATATASNRATISTLKATNITLTSALTACQLQLVNALQDVAKLTTVIADLNKNTISNHPIPEIGTTAGLMDTPLDIQSETAENLEPGTTRAHRNLIQKGAQL